MGNVTKPKKRDIEISERDGRTNIKVPDIDTLLSLFNTDNGKLAIPLLKQAVKAAGPESGGFIVAFLEDFEPRDATERLLTIQLAATHIAMINVVDKMNGAQHVESLEVFDRSYNRLARTFTTQLEAMRRHRTGGQSKVIVEHVTVNSGGQAIVGNVERGRGGQ